MLVPPNPLKGENLYISNLQKFPLGGFLPVGRQVGGNDFSEWTQYYNF